MELLDNIGSFDYKKSDKFSYTILIYDTKCEDAIEEIKNKLKNLNKKVSNGYKKRVINERVYQIITFLETNNKLSENINYIFLINNIFYDYEMTKRDVKFCKKWNINNFIFHYDEYIKIDYLKDLFSENKLKKVFRINDSLEIIKMDRTKSLVIENIDNLDEIVINKNIQDHNPELIFGLNKLLKKIKLSDNVFIKNLNNEQLMDIIETNIIKNNQEMLQIQILDNLLNPEFEDKFIFGRNDVSFAIDNFMIKKLFVNQKLLKKLKENIEKYLLNFEIIEIISLETGDIGQEFNKNYGGIIGVKYF